MPKSMFGAKITLRITKSTPYPQWSLVVAALFFGAAFLQLEQGFSSRWREWWTVPNISQFWHKTFRPLLKCWRWRGISPFNTTTTQSIPPNQQKNGFTRRRSKLWNGPARARTWIQLKIWGWPEEGCAQEMPSQSDRFGALLQGRVGKDSQGKMCHVDRLLPQKTECCHKIRRCFNRVLV